MKQDTNAPELNKAVEVKPSPICTAIHELSVMRLQIVEKRQELLRNPLWESYNEHWKAFTNEIAEIDRRFDGIVARAAENESNAPETLQ
jgi:hypothetical protein